MSEALIRKALEKHLKAFDPAFQTAGENVNFAPTVGVPFQSQYLMMAAPDNRSYGKSYLQRGYLQVGLHYPTNTGPGAAQAHADALRAHFYRGLTLVAGAIKVVIELTPEITPGDVEDGRFVKRVKVRFFAEVGVILAPEVTVFDFAAGVMPEGFIGVRASGATRINSKGFIELVDPDLPRLDYDPVTLQCKGMLAEDSRTNYLLNSSVFGTNLPSQTIPSTGTTFNHVLSFYGSGTVTISGGHAAIVVGTGEYPVKTNYAFTPVSGQPLTFTVSGNVQFAQLERASGYVTGSSFIPSSATAGIRAGDAIKMTGHYFKSFYNQDFGAMVVEAIAVSNIAGALIAIGGPSPTGVIPANHYIRPRFVNLDIFTIRKDNVVQAAMTGVINVQAINKLAFSYAENDLRVSLNGGAIIADNVVSIPKNLDTLYFTASSGAVTSNTHIRKITYFPTTKTNAELQELST